MPRTPTKKINRHAVREFRDKAHLNQGQAAARAGLSASYWCEVESGTKRFVSLSALRQIAEALEIGRPEALVYEEPVVEAVAA